MSFSDSKEPKNACFTIWAYLGVLGLEPNPPKYPEIGPDRSKMSFSDSKEPKSAFFTIWAYLGALRLTDRPSA